MPGSTAVRVTLPSGTPAELAVPAGTPTVGLALAPDIGGLRPLFDELCARLSAEHGWAVCAPEPFPGQESMPVPERLGAVAQLSDERQVGDLVAAADRTGAARTAVLGFCMGGMYALKAAGTGRFDRAVSFYGMIRVPKDWSGAGHAEPLEALRGPDVCPVLALIGGRDQWTPPEDVAALEQLPHVTVVRYPEAEHGFAHDPSRPAHRPDDAADAWRRAIEFLGG
jgi:carboxymethylenebutenolidase